MDCISVVIGDGTRCMMSLSVCLYIARLSIAIDVFDIMLVVLSALPGCEVSCVLSMRAFSTADVY